MRFLEIIVLLVLFIALLTGVYFLWINLPTESIEFQEFKANISQEFPLKSVQFYSNMRFPSKEITYTISENCSQKKQEDFEKAKEILEEKTVLRFKQVENGEIEVSCSNVAPNPAEEGHFIAGEGGPTSIINNTKYSVILGGKIALYRSETCPKPQIALHELLHALGFEHNSNENSIMYPVTNCKQSLGQEIIEDINSLYNQPEEGDLIIETIKANKTGRYLNFEIITGNYGLKEIKNSSLVLKTNKEEIKSFSIGSFDIGTKRQLKVTNLQIPPNIEEIYFEATTPEPEISKDNNRIKITLIQSSK